MVAILLGTAIMLVSLSFVYNWHNYFNAYTAQLTPAHNSAMVTAEPIESRALARMAITYCANQLVRAERAPFEFINDDESTTIKGDVLTFYSAGQQLTIDQILSGDVTEDAHYNIRSQQEREFQLEVSYD